MDEWTVKSDMLETKPFKTYDEAKTFAKGCLERSSVFTYLDICKNGKSVEMIH